MSGPKPKRHGFILIHSLLEFQVPCRRKTQSDNSPNLFTWNLRFPVLPSEPDACGRDRSPLPYTAHYDVAYNASGAARYAERENGG